MDDTFNLLSEWEREFRFSSSRYKHISVDILSKMHWCIYGLKSLITRMPIDALYSSNPLNEMTSMSLPNDNINTTYPSKSPRAPYKQRLQLHTHPDLLDNCVFICGCHYVLFKIYSNIHELCELHRVSLVYTTWHTWTSSIERTENTQHPPSSSSTSSPSLLHHPNAHPPRTPCTRTRHSSTQDILHSILIGMKCTTCQAHIVVILCGNWCAFFSRPSNHVPWDGIRCT